MHQTFKKLDTAHNKRIGDDFHDVGSRMHFAGQDRNRNKTMITDSGSKVHTRKTPIIVRKQKTRELKNIYIVPFPNVP